MKKKIFIGVVFIAAILSFSLLFNPPNEKQNPSTLKNLNSIKTAAAGPLAVVTEVEEFRVNNYTLNDQNNPSISALSEDSFVLVWESEGQDGSESGVYASVFNATSGANITVEFRVNDYTSNDQINPSVSALSEDSFVVAWQSEGQDGDNYGVYASVFNALTGAKTTAEFRVNDYTSNGQYIPSVSALSEDSFVVAWTSDVQDGDSYGVYASVFNATTGANTTAEFRVNDYTTNSQNHPSVSALSIESFVVAWVSSGQDGSGSGVYASVFNATSGANITAEFRVNAHTSNGTNPTVCALSEDSFAVAWIGTEQSVPFAIKASVFNAPTGANTTAEFRVNDKDVTFQWFLSVSALSEDSFAVAWEAYDIDIHGIYARVFNALTGAKTTAEFLVNDYTTDSQRFPSVSAVSNSTFAVAWSGRGIDDLFGVYASIFSIKLAPGKSDSIPSYQPFLLISILGVGVMLLIWKNKKSSN
jgi:uncharacterized protein with NRDE domain